MGLLLVGLAGCDPQYIDFYTCTNPDKGHKDADGEPDPCHRYHAPDGGADAGDDGGPPPPSCEVGQYAHWLLPWQPPTLLWVGPPGQAPECPLGPTTLSYEGHADLVAPSACEACTCEPSTGSCALPSTLTASTNPCSMPGGAATSFNAPSPWDGSCDGTIQTPSGAAHSLTIDPIKLTENGCAAGPTIPAKVISLRWDTFARGCDVGLPVGPIERSACLPDDPIVPGFKACIYFDGETDCPNNDPSNVFTEQHVFYQGVEDERQCSTCTCGAPTGSACTAMLSIYKGADLTCAGQALAQNTISSTGPTCIDIQLPGQSLGSKSAGLTTYLPGTCPPMGGDPSGTASPTHPATLCCRT
jgi:hypothetical protein